MNSIIEELKKELRMIAEMEKKASDRLKNAPQGHVRVTQKRGKAQYYYKNSQSSDLREREGYGRYMRTSEYEFARKIVQRDYDTQLLKALRIRKRGIEKFVEIYGKTGPGDIYDLLNPGRRELVSPLIISDEEYVRRWLSVEYKGKNIDEETGNIITERGERVRSKSEKIIADKLYAMGLPYRYEYPVTLKSGIRVYPDFTILKMSERKEIYLEHFGLLDEETYFESTLRKLHSYSENDIFLGDNLLITYETSSYPLSTKMLDGILRGLLQ